MRFGTIVLGAVMLSGLGHPAGAQQRGNQDILVTLRNAGNFTWFLRAVDGAKLTQQLKTGEYTVFAPTDDAFSRVPGTRRDSLLRDPAALEALVRNHVVEGRFSASQASSGARGMSFLGGGAIKAVNDGSQLRINGAQVIKADMAASNGMIHVINQVWLPPLRVRVGGASQDGADGRPSPHR